MFASTSRRYRSDDTPAQIARRKILYILGILLIYALELWIAWELQWFYPLFPLVILEGLAVLALIAWIILSPSGRLLR